MTSGRLTGPERRPNLAWAALEGPRMGASWAQPGRGGGHESDGTGVSTAGIVAAVGGSRMMIARAMSPPRPGMATCARTCSSSSPSGHRPAGRH
jgi:hypothetical protein